MHPFQILFIRQGLTVILCSVWMWWSKVPDFPLGKKEVRGLLVARSFSGFFGIFGMYCEFVSFLTFTYYSTFIQSIYWCEKKANE